MHIAYTIAPESRWRKVPVDWSLSFKQKFLVSFRLLHHTAKTQKSGVQQIVWTYLLPYSLTIYILYTCSRLVGVIELAALCSFEYFPRADSQSFILNIWNSKSKKTKKQHHQILCISNECFLPLSSILCNAALSASAESVIVMWVCWHALHGSSQKYHIPQIILEAESVSKHCAYLPNQTRNIRSLRRKLLSMFYFS